VFGLSDTGARIVSQPEPRYFRDSIGDLPVDERFIICDEVKP
jgi:hypothetical protein